MLPCNTTGHNNKSIECAKYRKKIYKKDNNNSEKFSLQLH